MNRILPILVAVLTVPVFYVCARGADEERVCFDPSDELRALTSEVFAAAPDVPDQMQRIGAYNDIARIQELFRNREGLSETLKEMARENKKIRNQDSRLEVITALLGHYVKAGMFEEAYETVSDVVSLQIRTELNIAIVVGELESTEKEVPERVRKTLEKVLETASRRNNFASMARANGILGMCEVRAGNKEKALEYFKTARKNAESLEAIERDQMLTVLMVTEIDVGFKEEALACLESLLPSHWKDELLLKAGAAFVAKSDSDSLERLLPMIRLDDDKATLFFGLFIGEGKEKASLERARTGYDKIEDETVRKSYVSACLQKLIEWDRIDDARKLAQEYGTDEMRVQLELRYIEENEEKPDFDRVIPDIEKLENSDVRVMFLRKVSFELLKLGEEEKAFAIMDSIRTSAQKDSAKIAQNNLDTLDKNADYETQLQVLAITMNLSVDAYDMALVKRTLLEMEKLANTLESFSHRIAEMNRISETLFMLGFRDDAKRIVMELYKDAEKENNPNFRIIALEKIASMQIHYEDTENLKKTIIEVEKLIDADDNLLGKATDLVHLATARRDIKDFDAAVKTFRKAKLLADKVDDAEQKFILIFAICNELAKTELLMTIE